jgi:aminoglycoside/choline kinase family phosphotransferase
MSFPPRPLAEAPSCDGMALEPALREVWGELPADATLERLPGQLSTRSYYRVKSALRTPESLVVMRLAEADTATLAGKELPFVSVQRQLAALSIRVPAIYADHSARGLVVLEDLGDETFEARLARTPRVGWSELYGRAIDLLADLHERTGARGDGIAYTRAFDAKLLRWELEHFREWGLAACGHALSAAEAALLDQSFSRLVEELLALPQAFTHRDYQSRNLMWSPAGELVVIDFQDALLGPLGYDLAALLCDSYVALDAELQERALARYAARRGLELGPLTRAFRLVSLQRKLKDTGRFVFIDQVRGIPSFLPAYGPSLVYVGRALAALPDYAELAALLTQKLAGFPDAVPTPAARTARTQAGA